MARPSRQAPSTVTTALLAQPQRFSYEQVVRLLQWQGVAKPLTQPYLSLGFPAVDVMDLQIEPSNQPIITTTLLGLYGPSSPLPTFYTEELLEEAAEDGSVTRDFFNLLNQPLYQLYYQAWHKYQLMLRWIEQRDTQLTERLMALVGFSSSSSSMALSDEQLPYAGLFNNLSRSALGLETLLAHATGCSVTLEPFVACWAELPQAQRLLLGEQANYLGEESYLGEQILDRGNSCRLHISVSEASVFADLLPNQPRYLTLMRFLRSYLLDPIDVQLWLWPDFGVIAPTLLAGSSASWLGINCCLGEHDCSMSPWKTQLPLGVN